MAAILTKDELDILINRRHRPRWYEPDTGARARAKPDPDTGLPDWAVDDTTPDNGWPDPDDIMMESVYDYGYYNF